MGVSSDKVYIACNSSWDYSSHTSEADYIYDNK